MLRFLAITSLLLILHKGGIVTATIIAANLYVEHEGTALNSDLTYLAENNLEYLNRAKREITLNSLFITNKNKIGVLEKRSNNGSRIAGDIYIGTTNGVYLKYVGTHDINKIKGINKPVAAIDIDFNGGAYVTTSIGTLYYIDQNGDNNQGLQRYVPYRILSIGILKKKSSGSRNAGDIYIGTTKGVYLKYVGTHTVKKIQGINEPVAAINIDFNGGAYATTSDGKLYYIDETGDNKQGLQNYIPDKILSIGVLQENSFYNLNGEQTAPGSRIAGDIYIGTTEGLYLKYVGTHTIKKIDGINEPVTAITFDFNGAVFVTTSTGALYYIDHNGENTQGVQSYIPNKILSTRCLKYKSSGTRNAGDMYIGTTEGVYLKYVHTHDITKIDGIDEPVIEIDIDFNGGAYVTTSTGKLYYIDENGDNLQGLQTYVPAKIL